MGRKTVVLAIAVGLVAITGSSLLAYAAGVRVAADEYERQSLIMYANLLGEQLIEVNRLASTTESPELQDYMRQEMRSFAIVVGCGNWYGKLDSVDRSDLPQFSEALNLVTTAIGSSPDKHVGECVANL